MTTRLFGSPIQRREDPRLVTGNGRYLDDLTGDALAAAFVRSPHAHARIVDIDVTGALAVDGVLAIYTYEDLDGRVAEPLPLLIPHPGLTHPKTAYPLAKELVHHVGGMELCLHELSQSLRAMGDGEYLMTIAAVEFDRRRHRQGERPQGVPRRAAVSTTGRGPGGPSAPGRRSASWDRRRRRLGSDASGCSSGPR